MPVVPRLSAGYDVVVVLVDLAAGGGSSRIIGCLECSGLAGCDPSLCRQTYLSNISGTTLTVSRSTALVWDPMMTVFS